MGILLAPEREEAHLLAPQRQPCSTDSGTATGGGVADPVMSTTDTAKVRRKRTLKNRFGLQRLHPDHTNPALRSKVNDPRVSGSEAKEAQVALGDRVSNTVALPSTAMTVSSKQATTYLPQSGLADTQATLHFFDSHTTRLHRSARSAPSSSVSRTSGEVPAPPPARRLRPRIEAPQFSNVNVKETLETRATNDAVLLRYVYTTRDRPILSTIP